MTPALLTVVLYALPFVLASVGVIALFYGPRRAFYCVLGGSLGLVLLHGWGIFARWVAVASVG